MAGWIARKPLTSAPACGTCLRYEDRVPAPGRLEHRCHVAEPGFPHRGRECACFIYHPGSDPQDVSNESD
jgi:hypothetical protein